MLHLSVSVIIKFRVYTTTALSTIENPMKKNLSNAAAAAEAAAASLMKQIVVTATAHLRIAPPAMGHRGSPIRRIWRLGLLPLRGASGDSGGATGDNAIGDGLCAGLNTARGIGTSLSAGSPAVYLG